jgi:hypothetical protein
VGGGIRKMSRGVFVKRQSPLVRVEINFSWRSYVKKVRMEFLWDLNVVDRFTISSKGLFFQNSHLRAWPSAQRVSAPAAIPRGLAGQHVPGGAERPAKRSTSRL